MAEHAELTREERREASKASASLFKGWNDAGVDLAVGVATKLREILDSGSRTYGPSVPVLRSSELESSGWSESLFVTTSGDGCLSRALANKLVSTCSQLPVVLVKLTLSELKPKQHLVWRVLQVDGGGPACCRVCDASDVRDTIDACSVEVNEQLIHSLACSAYSFKGC